MPAVLLLVVGKAGLRRGGLEVETWGLKVTLREGLGGLVESCEWEGRRVVRSEGGAAAEEAMGVGWWSVR